MTNRNFTVVLDSNRRDGKLAAIHEKGCQATAKDQTRGSMTMQVSGTLQDALNVAVDGADRDMGYDDSDAKVHACAR